MSFPGELAGMGSEKPEPPINPIPRKEWLKTADSEKTDVEPVEQEGRFSRLFNDRRRNK